MSVNFEELVGANPLVSVVIPLFNRADLVEETLRSIRSQSFRSYEVIVVDDGSSDEGPQRVEEFCDADSRFRLIRRNTSERGAAVCRNLGLIESRGRFVLFLDSDDLLSVNCLKHRVELLTATADLELVVGQGLIFRSSPGDQRLLWNVCDYAPNGLIVRFLDQDMPWANGAGLWRRECLELLGGWNPHLRCFQDWELHLRACVRGLRIAVLPEPDFYIRRNDSSDQISSSHNTQSHVESRMLAFESVMTLLESRNELTAAVRKSAQGFLIRNFLSLSDAGCQKEADMVICTVAAQRLLGPIDRWLLDWIRRHGPSWHWNRRVKRVADFWWAQIPYDTATMHTGFLNTMFSGVMPAVGTSGVVGCG